MAPKVRSLRTPRPERREKSSAQRRDVFSGLERAPNGRDVTRIQLETPLG